MTTDWTEQASRMFQMWSDGQKAWLDSLGRPGAGMAMPFAPAPGVEEAARQFMDAWRTSIDQWLGLFQQGGRLAFSQEHLRKILDPAEWAKPVPGSFDFGFERIIEGPTFATLWDLDRKLLRLQQLGVRKAEDSAAYHTVVFAAWNRAVERFTRELADRNQPALGSYRELIDLWIKTANDTLIEVHRSPEFLEAQRRVTRSATDYRLAEREIAEDWCTVHHIPTRTEVDELQRIVHELRRDVRALLRKVDAAAQGGAPKPPRPAARRSRRRSGAPRPPTA